MIEPTDTAELPVADFNFYLFLDIDDVLNPSAALSSRSTAWPDYQWVNPRTQNHIVSPMMIQELNDFIREYQPTVITVSMHEDRAKFYCQLIGLEGTQDWSWLNATLKESNVWPKFESVTNKATSEGAVSPSIWIDDELNKHHEASLWAAENGVLALSPIRDHGITKAHLVQMRNYAEGVREKNNLEQLLKVVNDTSSRSTQQTEPIPVQNSESTKAAQFYKSFESLNSSSKDSSSERYV